MLRIISLFLLWSGFYLQANAQSYKDFEFNPKPDFDLTDSKKSESEAILLKKYSVEYSIGEQAEEQYTFHHEVIWVNSDDAISKNNKIYLAAKENSEYLFQKARVIKPSGEIRVLKDEDIKEGIFEENDNKYYYFALEGLEKGSIIEKSSYKRSGPNYYGSIVYLQGEVDVYNQTFELIAPSHLDFAFKSINKAPEISYDTSIDDYNRWHIQVERTEKITDKTNFYDDVVKQAILYKLDRNISRGLNDITSYGAAAQRIFENVHPSLSKTNEKELKKIFKELKLKELDTNEEKIRAIENYVKGNFQVLNVRNAQLSSLDFILKNKATNASGMTILHLALLKEAGLKYELVITSDRSSIRFDPEYESYLFLDKYLIYFPKLKKYLSPSESFFRLGIIPALLTNNYGLFIKAVKVGDLETAIGKVKFIPALAHSATTDNMWIDVDFSKSLTEPVINIKRSSTGYSAQVFQPYIHLLDEEEEGNLKEELVNMISEEIEVKKEDIHWENVAENDLGVKPFSYEFTTSKHPFIEKAGEDILFKIGETIGPQVEMYQEDERQNDVESDHNRSYHREITFTVPEGYEVQNPDALNIEYRYGNESRDNLVFDSSYEKNGNQYKVICVEYYADIINPVADFEKYTTVINAAADFNKIVLILKKK